MFEVGDLVPLTLQVKNPAGGLADAGAVHLTVTRPDGTVLSDPGDLTITHPGLGAYACDVPAAAEGRHTFRWVATGANAGAQAGVFTIEAAEPVLVSTTEALAHLRASGLITKVPDLEQLRWLVRVASSAVELDLNRVMVPRTITETRYDSGTIVLRQGPVRSITSVTVDGVTSAPSTYRMRTDGILETQYGWTSATVWGTGQVVITYVAGEPVPPPIARKVCLNGVARMWQQSQQLPHPALDDLGSEAVGYSAGILTPLEMAAYSSLRRLAIA